MRIAVGCDHRGITLKKKIIELLTEAKHEYEDCGTYTGECEPHNTAQDACR